MLNYLKKVFKGKKPIVEAEAMPIDWIEKPKKHSWYDRHPVKNVRIKNDKYRPMQARLQYPMNDTWNPLLKFPRNHTCVCASGKKFKKCCLPRMSKVVSIEAAKFVKERWDDLLSGKLSTKDLVGG